MNVRAQRAGSVVVLDLEGQFTVSADTSQLHDLIERTCALELINVVLNLEKVTRLDCSGIGELVEIHNLVRDSGSYFTLVNIELRQRKLLKRMGLLTVFEIPNYECEVMLRGWRPAERARVARFESVRLPRGAGKQRVRVAFCGAS